MSNQSEIVASYFQALEQSNISLEIQVATFALFLYNLLLNFSREVDLIWNQKFRPLSLLYILIYYPQIIGLLLATILNPDTPHCTAILQFSEYIQIMSTLANTVFQITRTYAISGQSWIVASSLALLSLPPIILDVWSITMDTCINSSTSAISQKYVTIEQVIGLLFSILVVIFTVLKTFQSSREHKNLHITNNHNLAGLILANGSLYFILILSINIIKITLYSYGSTYPQNIASTISDILTTMLISRFLLALRENAVNPNGSASAQLPHISSLRIAVNHLHSVMTEEFGVPLYYTSYEERQAREAEDIALEDLDAPHAAVTVTSPIDIEEFPWTGRIEIGDREVAGI